MSFRCFSIFERDTDLLESTGRNVTPKSVSWDRLVTRDDGSDMRLWALGLLLVPCRGREVRDWVGRGMVRVAVS
jgi:hypothetical protein